MWLEQLQQHRFYRQNQLNLSGNTANEDSSPTSLKNFHSPRGSLPRGLMPNNAPKSLIQEFNQMDERMQNQLLSIQQHAVNLGMEIVEIYFHSVEKLLKNCFVKLKTTLW